MKVITLLEKKKRTRAEKAWLDEVAKIYKVKFDEVNLEKSRSDLLARIDIVPVSLFLAQAANESAWGTSRFAKYGNNYFGEWCFQKNCGIVLRKRNKGSTHEVKKFNSVEDSVRSYIQNLNSNNSYEDFRNLRKPQRLSNKDLSSIILVGGISSYSERKSAYVKEIRSMIVFNKLNQYDV